MRQETRYRKMLEYLRKVIARGTAESSRRFSAVVATLAFAAALLILCLGQVIVALVGYDIGFGEAIWGVSIGLAGLAGYAYTVGPAPHDPSVIPELPPVANNATSAQPDPKTPA